MPTSQKSLAINNVVFLIIRIYKFVKAFFFFFLILLTEKTNKMIQNIKLLCLYKTEGVFEKFLDYITILIFIINSEDLTKKIN